MTSLWIQQYLHNSGLDEERKESVKIADAFLAGKSAKGKRTYTDGKSVYLHNNKIAWHGEGGKVHMTHAGWGTTTTKERLNTIATRIGHGRPFYHKKHVLHHDGKEISDRDVITFDRKTNEETINETTDWKRGFGKRRTSTHKDTWDDPNFDKDFPGVKEKMIAAKKKSAERLGKWFKDHPIKEETQVDEGVTNWGMVKAIKADNERRAKNPVAKDLRSPKYKKRVVKDKTKYTRKEKHKKLGEGFLGTVAAMAAIGALGAYQSKTDKKKSTSSSVASGVKSAGQKLANEEQIDEKAVSKSQQKLFGMALAMRRGESDRGSEKVAKLAADLSQKKLRDFAKTKRKGLPDHVKKKESK